MGRKAIKLKGRRDKGRRGKGTEKGRKCRREERRLREMGEKREGGE